MSNKQRRNYLVKLDENTAVDDVSIFIPAKLQGSEIYQFRFIATAILTDYQLEIGLKVGTERYVMGQINIPGDPEAYRTFNLMPFVSNLRSIVIEQGVEVFVTPTRALTVNELALITTENYEPGES